MEPWARRTARHRGTRRYRLQSLPPPPLCRPGYRIGLRVILDGHPLHTKREGVALGVYIAINSVFATSPKTLICDRDIMTIDIADPTMTAYESILAALLVCDWGVRAWTLLEAMRGRSGLYILCLHNRVISLRELLKSVHAGGRIDLVTFFLGREYLFPPMAIANTELFGEIVTSEIEQEIEDGFVSMAKLPPC